jgi:hypothetical protein
MMPPEYRRQLLNELDDMGKKLTRGAEPKPKKPTVLRLFKKWASPLIMERSTVNPVWQHQLN